MNEKIADDTPRPDIKESWEDYLEWWLVTYPPESGAENISAGLALMEKDVASLDITITSGQKFAHYSHYFIKGFLNGVRTGARVKRG